MNEIEVKDKFKKLEQLLSVDQDERFIQQYLEQNAFMLTGFGGHVHKEIVISQLPLGSEYKTDFAWVDINSRSTTIHLIEIERPFLKIFNDNGTFTQKYNHAIQQLKDWHYWSEINQQYLVNLLEPLEISSNHLQINCHLIAGKHTCLTNTLKKRRYEALDKELPKWAHIQTWDGFVKNIPLARYAGSHSDDICCVSYNNQDYFEKQIENVIHGS